MYLGTTILAPIQKPLQMHMMIHCYLITGDGRAFELCNEVAKKRDEHRKTSSKDRPKFDMQPFRLGKHEPYSNM